MDSTEKHTIDTLSKAVALMTKDIQEIKTALLGSDYGDEGLVKKVKKNEEEIEKLITFKTRIMAWATGMGLGSGALINFLMDKIQ